MLLVVISAFWFLVAVRRKQRAEYGAGREQSQLLHRSVQYSTAHYSTVQLLHRSVQYSTVQYSTVQSTVEYSTEYSTVQYSCCTGC